MRRGEREGGTSKALMEARGAGAIEGDCSSSTEKRARLEGDLRRSVEQIGRAHV